jgi:UDP-glucose 4-epimerase
VIVVTGASGFIGRTVVETLAGAGVRVLAASRRPVTFDASVPAIIVKSYGELDTPVGDSVLLHLAEPRDTAAAEGGGEAYIAERRAALADLLAKSWGHVVYGSSAAVYGEGGAAPHRADEPIAPAGAYARAKVACEQDVLARGGTVARIANVYGRGMAPNNVIADILKQIPGSGPLMVRNRRAVRDFLCIDDLAKGLAMLAQSRRQGIFNFGTGRGVSVGELAGIALESAGEADRSVCTTATIEAPSHLVLDSSATSEALAWRAETSLENGLARLLGSRQ